MGTVSVIGIDPGRRTGYACLTGTTTADGFSFVHLHSEHIRPLQVGGYEEISYYASVGEMLRPDLVVVELPEVYPGLTPRASDIVSLAFIAGRALEKCTREVQAVERTKVPELLVLPKQWKGQVPKHIHHQRMFDKYPWLPLAVSGFKKMDQEHVIDAIGLAIYGMEHLTKNERIKR